MTSRSDNLSSVILLRADPASRDWFAGNWPKDDAPFNVNRFRAVFAGCGRRLRNIALMPEEWQALRAAGIAAPDIWSLDAIARAALLVRASEVSPAESHADLVRQVYLRGDDREQAAALRALPLLPDPSRFIDLAVEACRTNLQSVFEAIACENVYPAAHFSDAGFNQLVLKALFIGVAVDRIVGLNERNSDELRRMAADYASERRAAGRPVPADIHLVLEAHLL